MNAIRGRKYPSFGLVHLSVFSVFTNLLVLAMPLYMLQVYDRVLPSSNLDTLLYISGIALGALCILGMLEIVRAQYANRWVSRLDKLVGGDLFLASIEAPKAALGDVQPLRDLATIRSFVASRALFFAFDLPFTPALLALLYLIHPLLFVVGAAGAFVMVAVAVLNQIAAGRSSREAADTSIRMVNTAQVFGRNFETVRSLGMVANTLEVWGGHFSDSLRASGKVASANAFWGGVSRTVRLVLQAATLGVGAYLVLEGQITAGMIFAASMISSRALQPLDQIIGGWRQLTDFLGAWRRVKAIATTPRPLVNRVALPAPKGELTLSQVVYGPADAPQGTAPIIKGVTLSVAAGETLAIVGPSQAGKSTLARLIVGAIRPRSGTIRLDGADIADADPDELGRHLGYLSQEVDLFSGTIAQNISRFDLSPPEGAIVKAAQRSHAHQVVLGQRNGYDTVIGPTGVRLSGGERQRIGLARALYGDPKLLVLDEPNANLDTDGEIALERAILEFKAQGTTVVLITHRPSIAAKCDKILMLREGRVEAFGPAQEILARLAQSSQRGRAEATELRAAVAVAPAS